MRKRYDFLGEDGTPEKQKSDFLNISEEQEEDQEQDNPFGWMAMADAVSEVTRQPFSEIWEMGIIEFFNYFAYALYKSRKREEEINKFKRQY